MKSECTVSVIYGPCLLWPNGWMDQDATCYGSRPQSWPHCVRREPSSPCERGTAASLLFGPCLLWPWWPISATAELLLTFGAPILSLEQMKVCTSNLVSRLITVSTSIHVIRALSNSAISSNLEKLRVSFKVIYRCDFSCSCTAVDKVSLACRAVSL